MRMPSRVAAVLLLAVPAHAAASPVPAQTADPGPRLDAVVASYAALGQFSGAALVASNGKVVFAKGYGEANREWAVPNTPDTRFRMGSVTKQCTATLVMQLLEQGTLALDARLADVLPWYRQDTGAKVTIRNLLNHTSGIPNVTDRPNFRSEIQRRSMAMRDEITT